MAKWQGPVRPISAFVLLLGACACIWQSLTAQDTPSPWAQFSIVDVKPAMVDEFLAVQKELSNLAKKAKLPWLSVSRTAVFGQTDRFLIVTPLANLASLDRQEKASPEVTALNYRLQKCLKNRQNYGVLYLPQMSNPLPDDQDPGLIIFNLARVVPGREQDYLSVMKADFFPHFDEAEVHYATASLAFGGDGGFLHTYYVENFAELDQGSPVVQALGAEGAQAVTAKLSGIVSSSELWIARVVPELSFKPAAEATQD